MIFFLFLKLPEKIIFPTTGGSLNGFFKWMRSLSASFLTIGYFEITSSTIYGHYVPTNIAFQSGEGFHAHDGPSEWVMIDFKDNLFMLTHYTIRSWNDPAKSWRLQGSNTSTTWTNLHTVSNLGEMCATDYTKTFSTTLNKTFRYYRLQNTGVRCWNGGNYFAIGSWELFGYMNYNLPPQTQIPKLETPIEPRFYYILLKWNFLFLIFII